MLRNVWIADRFQSSFRVRMSRDRNLLRRYPHHPPALPNGDRIAGALVVEKCFVCGLTQGTQDALGVSNTVDRVDIGFHMTGSAMTGDVPRTPWATRRGAVKSALS